MFAELKLAIFSQLLSVRRTDSSINHTENAEISVSTMICELHFVTKSVSYFEITDIGWAFGIRL